MEKWFKPVMEILYGNILWKYFMEVFYGSGYVIDMEKGAGSDKGAGNLFL